ncbi:uncharacterized protein LOC144734619 [Lampetra planeri]
MGGKKVATPFQSSHILQYGMELITTEANGAQSCRCLFCVHQGRDVVEVTGDSGRKRKNRTDIKYFTKPFLLHQYRHHLEGQHKESWMLYQTLSPDEKKSYFNGMAKRTNTLHNYMDLSTASIDYVIQNSIIETIIGDLFFRDDDEDSGDDNDDEDAAAAIAKKAAKKAKEKVNAMKLFVKNVNIEMGTYTYTATIKNEMRFELAMDHVGVGMSFRQTAAAIDHARIRTNTPKLQGMNDLIVTQSVRVLVAVGLQMIARIIDNPSVWAFSLAGDGSTHRGQSFFDLRTRVCYRGFLVNLHLVAIPMFERHTAQNIFRMLVKFLDALYPNWRAKLIGFSSDGENTMTGRHGGLVTLIVKEAENDVIRIWCPPHQIDIVVKKSAECVFDGSWVKIVYDFSVYLRAQNNLIIKMKVKCPRKANRWANLGNVLKFYKQYRRALIEYTTENNPAKLPTADWWVLTYALAPAIDTINVTIVQLQSQSLLIAQQEEHIQSLIGSLTVLFSVEIVDGVNNHDEAYVSYHDQSMRIASAAIIAHIEDQGSFAQESYEGLNEVDKTRIVKEISIYAMTLIAGLNDVKAERNDANRALDQDAAPVMPAQLVKMRPGVFVKDVLAVRRVHVTKFWSAVKVDMVEEEHRQLVKLYKEDTIIHDAINKHTNTTTFNDAWDVLPSGFDNLRAFSGGLASVLANTTAVESDFSILKWELDEFRSSMMHLSLEGIFQTKQRRLLVALLR